MKMEFPQIFHEVEEFWMNKFYCNTPSINFHSLRNPSKETGNASANVMCLRLEEIP